MNTTMGVKAYSNPPPWLDWFNEMSTDTMNGAANGHTNGHKNGHDEKKSSTGIAPGLEGEYVDPHLKTQRDYESDYAKLALQGGHKGLLSMNNESAAPISTTDEFKRSKGCGDLSDYNKIAHQGGHKDLLKIADNNGNVATTPSKKMQSPRTCGDWYKITDNNNSNNNNNNNNNNPSPPKSPLKSPTSDKPQVRDQRKGNGNCIVPGGPDEAPRYGKKRFESTARRQEAPFATNF